MLEKGEDLCKTDTIMLRYCQVNSTVYRKKKKKPERTNQTPLHSLDRKSLNGDIKILECLKEYLKIFMLL